MNIMIARTRMLLRVFFIGDTPPIDPHVIEKDRANWEKLEAGAQAELIQDLTKKADARRASISENASRCNFLIAGLAFIFGAGVTIMLQPGMTGALILLFKIGNSLLLLSTGILLVTISAKAKILRRQLDYRPKASKLLSTALENQAEHSGKLAGFGTYLHQMIRLHKCDFILMVERRAVWTVMTIATLALLILLIAIDLR